MISVRKVLLFLIPIFFVFQLVAENNTFQVTPTFKYLNSSDGLPQNTVLDILQDSKGLMWFATYDGLCRYDGVRLKVFSPELNNNHTINNGSINRLLEGSGGLIYCSTEGGGLNVFDPKTETFTYYLADTTENSVVDNILYGMCLASDSTIWISSYNGLSHFYPETRTFDSYFFGENREFGYPNESSLCVFEDNKQQIWIGTYGSGLLKYNKEVDGFESFFIGDKLNINTDANSIFKIAQISDNELLLATSDGAFLFNTRNKTFKNYYNIRGELSSVLVDSKGVVWIASENSGVYKIENQQLSGYTHDVNNLRSLSDDYVYSVYEDKDGIIWLGLRRFGVAYFNPNQQPFYHLNSKNNDQSLVSNDIIVVENSPNSEAWIGTGKGISIWDYKNNTVKKIPNIKKSKHNTEERIWALYSDTLRNKMWIGTPTGLYAYDFQKRSYLDLSYGSVMNDTSYERPKTLEGVFCLSNDKEGRLWVGTYYGLFRYDEQAQNFIAFFAENEESGLTNNSIWSLFNDADGNFWVGTAQGLCIYNEERDNFSSYFEKSDAEFSLSSLLIYDMEDDGLGNTWLATPMGIHIIDKGTGNYKYLGIEQGLSNNSVYTLELYKGSMWASTNMGLNKININDFSIVQYSAAEGLQADEFSSNGLVLDNGMLMFGGIAGISAFYPDEIEQNTLVPQLHFTELHVEGTETTPLEVRHGRQILDSSIIFSNTLHLSYKEHLAVIKFAALDYIASNKIRYRYKLSSNKDNWIEIGNRASLTMTELPLKGFELEIQSTNAEQRWVNNNIKLKVIVHPPFYKTYWFYSLIIVLLVILVFRYVQYRTKRVKKQNQKLEKAVVERTSEVNNQKEELMAQRDKISKQKMLVERSAEQLESAVLRRTRQLMMAKDKAEESDRLKSAFLANMSHEIRTPMNAIIGFSELLKYDDISEKERSQYVELVRTNSDSLMNLLNDILDISVIESGKISLHNETFLLEKILDEVFQSFKNSDMLKEKTQISLNSSYQFPQNLKITLDKARLGQVLHNLLSNAIKYTNCGVISLFAKVDNENIIIGVKDSGIGIKPEHQEVVFDRFYKADDEKTVAYRGGGLGLSISKNLIEFMGGKIWVESEYHKGSTFLVSFPATYIA